MNYDVLFNNLASNNSRLYKEGVLFAHKDDELLQQIIKLALDPMINFWIKKIPAYSSDSITMSLEEAISQLSDFSNRVVTGNAAIEKLKTILSSLSKDDAAVIERIIKKDLRCGAATTIANKIWPGLIFDYPCMLCSAYDEKLVKKIKFPAIVQKKEDGLRVNIIIRNGAVEFRSRNGKFFDLKGNLEKEAIEMANGKDIVFDGELLVFKDGKVLDRQTGNGILNRANRGTITEAEAAMVRVELWDMIPYEDFIQSKCDIPYETRFNDLVMAKASIVTEKVSIVESTVVESIEEARSIFNAYLAKGYEGIILKDKTSIWENKRSKTQVKFKASLDCDLRCIAVEEGEGKYEGLIGGLLCESEDGLLSVTVGTGLTDEDRKQDVDFFYNKIIAVKYNARIQNKQGGNSLFLPVFLEVRTDKEVADTIEKIK